jgi:hypothetical protein
VLDQAVFDVVDDLQSGTVTVERSTVSFLAVDDVQPLRLETRGSTSSVRAVPPPFVLVRCGTDQAFDVECEAAVEPGGDSLTLALQMEPDTNPEDVLGTLFIYAGGQARSVSIQSAAVARSGVLAREGRYRGLLQPLDDTLGRPPGQPVSLDAQVEQTPEGRRVLLSDPGQLLFIGSLELELMDSGGTWDATAGNASRLSAATDPAGVDWGADVALSIEPRVVEVGEQTVTLSLSTRPLGIVRTSILDAIEPRGYRLLLSRVGDLNADSMAAPEPRVLGDNPGTRAGSPSAWGALQGTAAPCPEDLPLERCAQRLLCVQATDDTPDVLQTAPEFGSSVDLSLAEDVECADTTAQAGFPAFASTLSGGRLLESCLEELEAFYAGPTSDSTSELLAPATCVAAPRVLNAIRLASDADATEGAALAQRLLKEWLQLHGFLLNEGLQGDRMRAILGSDPALAPTAYSLEDTLVLVGQGLDVVLHPRVAEALLAWSPSVLGAPDHRGTFVNEPMQNEAHANPVFVDLLNTLLPYLSTTQRLLANRCGSDEFTDDVATLASAVSRRTYVLLDVARILQQRAMNGQTEPPWLTTAEHLEQQLVTRLAQLHALLSTCHTGGNPLGIDDVDLPLYFGDASTANARFSAVSDYLIGAVPDARGAWVPAAIAEADDGFEDARDAWLRAAERNLSEQRSSADTARRTEAIRRRYGDQLLSLCGAQQGLSAEDVLDAEFDADTCYLSPECRPKDGELAARLSTGDLVHNLCVMGKLREHAGPVTGYGDGNLDSLADEFAEISKRTAEPKPGLLAGVRDWVEGLEPEHGALLDLALGATGLAPTKALIMYDVAPENALAEYSRLEPADADRLLEECDGFRSSIDAERRPDLLPASCADTQECPIGFLCLEAECQPETQDPLADLGCYSGALGERALSLRTLASDVDIAKSEFAELSDHYDIAMRGCMIQKLAGEAREEEIAAHNERMAVLEESKRDADRVAAVFEGVGQVTKAVDGGPYAVGAAVIGAVGGGVAKQKAAELEAQMAAVEEDHQLALDRIARRADDEECFNDATQHLVGARSAALRITRATQEAALGLLAQRNMKQQVRSLLQDGRAELENEAGRSVPPLAQNLWVDEHIDTYERKLRIAKRATYMAVRAVEYEFQVCLDQRQAVVAATVPEQLGSVVDVLLSITSTGAIGGRRPNEGVVVLSLKDDLLALADHSDFTGGVHVFSDEERLQLLLSSPRSAAFDESGRYLGQRVRFTLSPEALTDSASALVSGNACAERLWSVNASVLGDQVIEQESTGFVELELAKQNTFYSSLCPSACDSTGTDGRQLASIRPSRNLFIDPLAGGIQGVGVQSGPERDAYSTGRMRAYVDVARSALEAEEYREGDSEELAGRGLWGGYELLIPAAVIQQGDSGGLVLSNVTDILLRLEYVSVAAR